MGKKVFGSLFNALKTTFTSILHNKTGGKRVWLFTKSLSNIHPGQPLKEETLCNYGLEASNCMDSSLVQLNVAAICIQTAFRGHLARRASQALKGIVILQALIRGQIVRNQATIILKCMQSHIRVQTRLNNKQFYRCRVLYSPEQHTANSEDMKDFEERANRLIQWLETKHQGRSTYNSTVGQQSNTLSPIKTIKESPNYMAATESTKAKTRSQCSPKQSPLTPKTKQILSANKRLSFPIQNVITELQGTLS